MTATTTTTSSSIPNANNNVAAAGGVVDLVHHNYHHGSSGISFPPRLLMSPRRSHSTGNIITSSSSSSSTFVVFPSHATAGRGGVVPDERTIRTRFASSLARTARALRIPHYLYFQLLRNRHHRATLQKSRRRCHHRYIPGCRQLVVRWGSILELLPSIRWTTTTTTWRQKLACLFIGAIVYTSWYASYFLQIMPKKWKYETEWKRWEIAMQRSVIELMPPSLPPSKVTNDENDDDDDERRRRRYQLRSFWDSNDEYLMRFPYLMQGDFSARDHVVPVPDYESMGRIRTTLARRLSYRAIQSCENEKRRRRRRKHPPRQSPFEEEDEEEGAPTRHPSLLPVMGITVANDTPENRYLRRILHTIDLNTVGSIVITWYDELTEAQIVGKNNQPTSQSHDVVASALEEYIVRKGFEEISWKEHYGHSGNESATSYLHDDVKNRRLRLADATSLTMLSQTAISIQQFCMFAEEVQSSEGFDRTPDACRNELVLLRFPTNLGCSTGVNNPLFTHPTSPHWLIANYDIAYPSGVLKAMGEELEKTRNKHPDLAVHTYGYIYGRGKLENPWSNFVMTSCAVASAGVWDENIFPAYYEDDDYRDRIRYIAGIWKDVVGDPDRYENVPQQWMVDSHLIRYQTDRNVSVAHGPLAAQTYLSGTHETMKKVQDAENEEKNPHAYQKMWYWMRPDSKKPPIPLHYESERWSLAKEVSNGEGYFRCKHGALPDAGKHGEDPLRYFGWHERYLVPFVNRTRLTRMRESEVRSQHADGTTYNNSHPSNSSPWAVWSFNATRRQCVHDAINALLAMPSSEEKKNRTQEYKDSCSVC